MYPDSLRIFGKWISVLSRYGQMFISRHVRHLDVGSGQLPFLMTLYKADGVSLDHLSKSVVMDKATTTRAVIALEEAGLVTRVVDEEDRRVKRVYLTDKAQQIRPEIIDVLNVWGNVLTSQLTESERAQLIFLLEKVAASAVSHLNQLESTDKENKELKS